MPYPMSRPNCNGPAFPKGELVRKPDGSRWSHSECLDGHAFHRAVEGSPVQVTPCDCQTTPLLGPAPTEERNSLPPAPQPNPVLPYHRPGQGRDFPCFSTISHVDISRPSTVALLLSVQLERCRTSGIILCYKY
jgi:hypothetical protein